MLRFFITKVTSHNELARGHAHKFQAVGENKFVFVSQIGNPIYIFICLTHNNLRRRYFFRFFAVLLFRLLPSLLKPLFLTGGGFPLRFRFLISKTSLFSNTFFFSFLFGQTVCIFFGFTLRFKLCQRNAFFFDFLCGKTVSIFFGFALGFNLYLCYALFFGFLSGKTIDFFLHLAFVLFFIFQFKRSCSPFQTD